jgi:hypothetical protein
MNIYYCEVCGLRISNAELGGADVSPDEPHYCAKCTPKTITKSQPKYTISQKNIPPIRRQMSITTPEPAKLPFRSRLKPTIAAIAVLLVLGALAVQKGLSTIVAPTVNKKSIEPKDETAAVDLKSTAIPQSHVDKGTEVKRPIETNTPTKNQQAPGAKEILFEENFSKPLTGYQGERVEIEKNFVLKMQSPKSSRQFTITQSNHSNSRATSFLISTDTNISFRLNPGPSSKLGLRCDTGSKKGYYIYFKVTPNTWTTHSISFSKMKSNESSEFLPVGENFQSLLFVVFDTVSDAYVDDIVIWNEMPASK